MHFSYLVLLCIIYIYLIPPSPVAYFHIPSLLTLYLYCACSCQYVCQLQHRHVFVLDLSLCHFGKSQHHISENLNVLMFNLIQHFWKHFEVNTPFCHCTQHFWKLCSEYVQCWTMYIALLWQDTLYGFTQKIKSFVYL